ncbi:hypothetical protein M9Y10_023581 [Tritrichomonas musculus]|uniref:Myb-like DNA-binding domain containing protein n=1 Tax=Tritrichomonas musculus TaxID=1915356 RepID=A0ABR2KVL7_9EUKA
MILETSYIISKGKDPQNTTFLTEDSSDSLIYSHDNNSIPRNQDIMMINYNNMTFSNNQNISKEFKRKRSNKLKFTSDEDKKLLNLVKKYGEHNWKRVSSEIEGRNVRQCRDRYRHYLSPNINQSSWNDDEDNLLIKKVAELGFRWKQLEKFFVDRNEIQIRNRYYQITHSNNDNIINNQSKKLINKSKLPDAKVNPYQNNEKENCNNEIDSFGDDMDYFNSSDSYSIDESELDSEYLFFSMFEN